MKVPLITATYVAVLALLYAVLSLQVVRLRRRNRVGFGDGGNTALRGAIRAHAHFAEYVPIIVLMAAMLEMSGLAPTRIHVLMGGASHCATAPSARHACQARDVAIQYWPSGRHGGHHPCDDRLRTAHSGPTLAGRLVALAVHIHRATNSRDAQKTLHVRIGSPAAFATTLASRPVSPG